ncbi:hypothetical protein RRG08_049752 [Elysia crispata]|uniref:Uncharacterized protein n=1 Tax=Elysia crispata TaxID=231223 RepID=A0AAE1DEC6_9GAST|nr:hypothetical protein RRG08_049752 [Elysia crispata]
MRGEILLIYIAWIYSVRPRSGHAWMGLGGNSENATEHPNTSPEKLTLIGTEKLTLIGTEKLTLIGLARFTAVFPTASKYRLGFSFVDLQTITVLLKPIHDRISLDTSV